MRPATTLTLALLLVVIVAAGVVQPRPPGLSTLHGLGRAGLGNILPLPPRGWVSGWPSSERPPPDAT